MGEDLRRRVPRPCEVAPMPTADDGRQVESRWVRCCKGRWAGRPLANFTVLRATGLGRSLDVLLRNRGDQGIGRVHHVALSGEE